MMDIRKDKAILALISKLEQSLGGKVFDIVDHWEADSCAIGIASKSDHRTLVYVGCYGCEEKHYSFACEVADGEDVSEYKTVDEGECVPYDYLLKKVKIHLNL
ncbi:MAG: hypothetical protein AAGB19_16455 [Cyanobacteria bacterium P01_F01_bin.3]